MKYLLPILALSACAPHIVTDTAAPEAQVVLIMSSPEVKSIYWSDGDSGRIDGVKFRLSNVDAPETGGVGGRGGAKCEAERDLGYESKAFIVELTRDVRLDITAEYGLDRYDRLVIDLSADGQDVGRAGVEAGHLGEWPHKGRRALQKKPDWCGAE